LYLYGIPYRFDNKIGRWSVKKRKKEYLTPEELIKQRKNTEYCRRWRQKHPEKAREISRENKRKHKKVLTPVQKFLKKLLKI